MVPYYILAASLVEERASGGMRAGTALRVSLTALRRLCLGQLILDGAGIIVTPLKEYKAIVGHPAVPVGPEAEAHSKVNRKVLNYNLAKPIDDYLII